MFHCLEYFWQKGKPKTSKKLKPEVCKNAPLAYRIMSDPYKKRYSIEKYENGCFSYCVYDSNLFDFRLLEIQEPLSWEKEELEEGGKVLLRDQDQRVRIRECHLNPSTCEWYSVHGVLIARQEVEPNTFLRLRDPEGVLVMERKLY